MNFLTLRISSEILNNNLGRLLSSVEVYLTDTYSSLNKYIVVKQYFFYFYQRFCTFGAKLQDMTDRQNTVTPASVLPSGKWIDAASME